MFNDINEDDFYRYQDNLDPQAQRGHIIKQRLAKLRGEQDAEFYRPTKFNPDHDPDMNPGVTVTHTDTVSTGAGDSLEQDNCIHCHATYGHKISCPKINREAAEELSKIDDFFLRSLRIATN